MSYEKEKQVAIEAVTRAAQLCLAVQADMVNVDSLEKGDKSPVTVADFGAQAVVCQYVTANFPEAVIVGEEDSGQLRTPDNAAKLAQVIGYVQQFFPQADAETVCGWIDAGNGQVADRFWTLDPIDGTKGFLRNDQYGIALALIEQGQVKVAALAGPVLPVDLSEPAGAKGVVFVAVRGQGAAVAPLNSAEFTPIHVVPVTHPENVRFAESVEAAHGDQALQEALAQAAGITTPPLRMDSQVKYGAVARGDAALYLRLPSPKQPGYREKIWDHAAGSLIVEEAGGRVTDMHGRPLDFGSDYKMHDNRGVIVSNGELHEVVLVALADQ
ncbi:MAG: 3'(2'),5'-bisphosphate nucleotidase [Anaerolineaceae bacterium]|nr:3'(2'),5'-bisphosphate nucleotidase [Anaerolineaceae bacterium]MCB9099536.1 3'(2'),5'-bisphosphate nucleotidase [Anaerolineales bacterium]